MWLFAKRMKSVVESTGCLAVVLPTNIHISGGNANLARYAALLTPYFSRCRMAVVRSVSQAHFVYKAGNVVDGQLAINGLDVVAHGRWRALQLMGNFLVASACRDQLGNGVLA